MLYDDRITNPNKHCEVLNVFKTRKETQKVAGPKEKTAANGKKLWQQATAFG